jgi:alpha-L-fucosidase
MTICRQWAWKPNDQMKSFKQCIQTLVSTVGGDGNLLFNVGPMPDGRIEPRQVDRLLEMGEWLKKYGDSIYGTRGGPFKTGSWGASTNKGNNIYIHVYNWGENGLLLPPIPKKIIASSVLTGGNAKVKQTIETIEISVPKAHRQEVVTIIKLHLDGSAGEIAPVSMSSSSLAYGKKAKASNIFQNSAGYGPAKAVDDDPATRWATDAGTRQAWLEIDLGKSTKFNSALIKEEFDRVKQFELQYKEGGQWQKITDGTKIGRNLKLKFSPVTARHVRLDILKAIDGPTIWEFQLFAPKKR